MKSVKEIINTGNYSSKLRTSEWRKFASGIKATRNFCECCRLGGKSLHVHHLFYDPSREPWEYSESELVVLCDTCHKGMHEQLQNFRKFVFRHLNPNLFQILNGCLAVGLTTYDPLTYMHALKEFTGNHPLVTNHARMMQK
jgi:5-methylcytosine-specific restriction endonuclease McrA